MPRYIYTYLLLFFIAIAHHSELHAKKIDFFEGTWQEAMQKAQKTQKKIFVETYAQWCVVCKNMERTVFNVDAVADYYNTNFINYKIDVESFEGFDFKAQYEISSLPTLLYLNANGSVILRESGMRNEYQFLSLAQKALGDTKFLDFYKTIDDPNRESHELNAKHEQYKKGKYSKDFLRDYCYTLQSNNLKYNEAVETYLKKFDKNTPEDLSFVAEFSNDFNNKAIDVLIKNRKTFEYQYGAQNTHKKLRNAILVNAAIAGFEKDKNLYTKSLGIIKKAKYNTDTELLLQTQMAYYQAGADWKNLSNCIIESAKKYKGKDAALWNRRAFDLMSISNQNTNNLQIAKEWALKSIAISPQYYNYETLAYIEYKLNNISEAKTAIINAIELCKKSGKDIGYLQPLMLQIYGSDYWVGLYGI